MKKILLPVSTGEKGVQQHDGRERHETRFCTPGGR